jgi:hypothetical protein
MSKNASTIQLIVASGNTNVKPSSKSSYVKKLPMLDITLVNLVSEKEPNRPDTDGTTLY